jgi:hypothetical protein
MQGAPDPRTDDDSAPPPASLREVFRDIVANNRSGGWRGTVKRANLGG